MLLLLICSNLLEHWFSISHRTDLRKSVQYASRCKYHHHGVFNIDCCCIFGTYTGNRGTINDVLEKYSLNITYLDHDNMQLLDTHELVPFAFFQIKRNARYAVKKLIKPEEKDRLLPIHLSDYYKEFIKGADLIPKSLLIVEIVNSIQEGKISIINLWISPQAKGV